MAENFPNLAKHINLHVQEVEKTPNRIKAKTDTSESNFWTLKTMKESWEQPEREALPRRRNNSHGRELLLRNHGAETKEVLSHFSIAERKEL